MCPTHMLVFSCSLSQYCVSGFYRGLGSSIASSCLSSGLGWIVYEQSKLALSRHYSLEAPGPGERQGWAATGCQVGAGIVAGVVSAVVDLPLDVVQTRLRTQHIPGQAQHHTFYRNTWHGATLLLKEEGISAFYRGIIPRLTAVPFFILSTLTYELVSDFSRDD
jgi:solute carrier family 25 (mitochondrial citrate transporter), member 1